MSVLLLLFLDIAIAPTGKESSAVLHTLSFLSNFSKCQFMECSLAIAVPHTVMRFSLLVDIYFQPGLSDTYLHATSAKHLHAALQTAIKFISASFLVMS